MREPFALRRGCLRGGDEARRLHAAQHDARFAAARRRGSTTAKAPTAPESVRRSAPTRRASDRWRASRRRSAPSVRRRRCRRSGRRGSGTARGSAASTAALRAAARWPPPCTLRPTLRAFERNSVRASCCVSVLPPSSVSPVRTIANDGACEAERVDAGVIPEAPVLGRDDRLLQPRRNARRAARRAAARPSGTTAGRCVVEDQIADAVRQAVDPDAVANQPPVVIAAPVMKTTSRPSAMRSGRRRCWQTRSRRSCHHAASRSPTQSITPASYRRSSAVRPPLVASVLSSGTAPCRRRRRTRWRRSRR